MDDDVKELATELRAICNCNIETSPCGSEYECRIALKAATVLESLSAENDRLQGALDFERHDPRGLASLHKSATEERDQLRKDYEKLSAAYDRLDARLLALDWGRQTPEEDRLRKEAVRLREAVIEGRIMVVNYIDDRHQKRALESIEYLNEALAATYDLSGWVLVPRELTGPVCSGDGKPCYVGQCTDDAHWRCGTVACAMLAAQEGK